MYINNPRKEFPICIINIETNSGREAELQALRSAMRSKILANFVPAQAGATSYLPDVSEDQKIRKDSIYTISVTHIADRNNSFFPYETRKAFSIIGQ